MEFVALDFETAARKRYSACQVGAVLFINGEIVDQYSTLIKPPNNEYHPINIGKHKITPLMTMECNTFNGIWPFLARFVENRLIVAHNASFDASVLRQSLEYYNLPIPKFQTACTCSLFQNVRLEEACHALGIELNHHEALSDAIACGKLYQYYIENQGKIPEIKRFPKQRRTYPKKISSEFLKPNYENCDTESIFFQRKVVLTGGFEQYPDRDDLAKELQGHGANINKSVSSIIDILICGQKPGPSKIKKVEKYQLEGKSIIKMTENELYAFLKR